MAMPANALREIKMAEYDRGSGWWRAVAGAALLALSAAIAPTARAQNTGEQGSTGSGQPIDLNSAPPVTPAPRPAGAAVHRPRRPRADCPAAQKVAASS